METNENSHHHMGFMISATWEELLIFRVMKCYINPIASVLGLAANIFSVIILCRSGLNKTPNILLMALAISDSMCMFITIDVPFILNFFDLQKKYPLMNGWQYEYDVAYVLYWFHSTMAVIGSWGCYVNTTIPVLITIERLCAIFWPMTFKKFITKQFAVASVTLVFIFWLPVNVICQVNIPFEYFNISERVIMGASYATEYYNSEAYLITLYVFEVLSSWVPTGLVSFGCMVIWIKLRTTLSKRRELTNSNTKWFPKTTRMLLATCLIFSITHITYSIIVYIYSLDFVNFDIYFNQYEILAFIYVINNSSNFFIYVAFNKKYRTIFRDVFKKSRIQYI